MIVSQILLSSARDCQCKRKAIPLKATQYLAHLEEHTQIELASTVANSVLI
jgi:hypothetical protein